MIIRLVGIILVSSLVSGQGNDSDFCELPFEGFGVFLGSVSHFSRSPSGVIKKTLDLLYHDLGIRYYRTSYEKYFSPKPDVYEIKCNDPFTCYWDEVQREISKFENINVFASIWIAPEYMMHGYELPKENQLAYLYFIRNVTNLIKDQYGIQIEKISPINEPENAFATWDHTNMSPIELCEMIAMFNDSTISLCPENSYVWISEWFKEFEINSTKCSSFCSIHVTHAYAPELNPLSSNFLLAYYDLTEYEDRGTNKHIWMTEVSSTWNSADKNQMKEALDLATNIVNMVAGTCIQRYYFWYAYTFGYSGESLIWGDSQGDLFLPKKYYAYKHFTTASSNVSKPVHARRCDSWTNSQGVMCVSFGDKNAIFVNLRKGVSSNVQMNGTVCSELCCTDDKNDYVCETEGKVIPALSVCACHNIVSVNLKGSAAESFPSRIQFLLVICFVCLTMLKSL